MDNKSDQSVDYRAIFQSAPGLYMILKPDFTIVAANEAYLKGTMKVREEILGRNVFDVFLANPEDPNPSNASTIRSSFETVLKTRTPHTVAFLKYDIQRPESAGGGFEERFWSTVNSPVLSESGEVVYLIHRAEDVTDFVHLQQESGTADRITGGLLMRTAQMESEIFSRAQEIQERTRELEQLNMALQEARDQAMEASNLKSAFIATISHELRTPLTAIIGLNELLIDTRLDEEQTSFVQSVSDSAQALLTIVNDILDLSKIEAGKAELEAVPFNLIYLVQDASRLLADGARKKDLHFGTFVDQSIPQFVLGDPTRVRQILINLIGNSIKFTESGGEISVRTIVEFEDTDSVTIRFSVTDTGMGISDEEMRFLFVPFSQVDYSNARRHGGTGLGLSICKRFVQAMGGEIGVESEKWKGSTFWFTVPFRLETDLALYNLHQRRRPSQSQPHLEGKLILVVEDSPVIQMLAVKQLRNLKLQAHAVSNGRAAVEAIKGFKFDLILMDCQMPGMDGFAATKAIRDIENLLGRHTPIIAMTAGAMVGDREQCLSVGMDDYLSKPFTIEQLREKIDQWLVYAAR